jgi:hypothetical protein
MTPGQAAYDKWRALLIVHPVPWEQIPESGKAGWEEVAQAAIVQYIGNSDLPELIAAKALDEAEVVTRLEDREGDTWTLRDNGYWSLLDPVGGWTRERIEECFGPLTEVSDGR